MQAIFGTRNAATINLVLALLILAGLYVGFYFARKKLFRPHHAYMQTTMVLLNLVLILSIMVPAFYTFVILGGTTTGVVGTLMIVHAILGAITEGVALYLVAGEMTQIIPKQYRIKSLKPVMRATLALWTLVAFLGFGIYYFRYLAPRPETPAVWGITAIAPLQHQADTLLIHADELGAAIERGSQPAIRRHSEHLINLIAGSENAAYGDTDGDGSVQDPGDGRGMLNLVQTIYDDAVALNQTQAVAASAAVRADLLKILADAQAVTAAQDDATVKPQVEEIRSLSSTVAGGATNSVHQLAVLLNATDSATPPSPTDVQGNIITVDMKDFQFQPKSITVKQGSTIVFVNQDNAKHTATADNNEFNTGDVEAGETGSVTFEQAGTFPYYCVFHGDKGGIDMAGVVIVER